jgi:hypothetical protein
LRNISTDHDLSGMDVPMKVEHILKGVLLGVVILLCVHVGVVCCMWPLGRRRPDEQTFPFGEQILPSYDGARYLE